MSLCNCFKKKSSCHIKEKDKQLIKRSWEFIVKNNEAEDLGKDVFIQFFKQHPKAMDHFLQLRNTNLGSLSTSSVLNAHVERVMSFLDQCVIRLDDEPRFIDAVFEEGWLHHGRHIPSFYVTSIIQHFETAIAARCIAEWTDRHQMAWKQFFRCFRQHFDRGVEAGEKEEFQMNVYFTSFK
ncbi:hypothetical protein Btru_027366 [Bulinus truncatus]|nr:hypothetical protein Btru_027366 [Bulinus truncatus]